MSLTIRQAILDDEARIRSFVDSAIPISLDANVHDIPAIIENVNSNLDKWIQRPKTASHFVADVEGEMVGAILVKEFWNLCSLFVHPEFQRRGIGKALILSVLNECRDKSPREAIFLNANDEAITFYQKQGFGLCEAPRPLPFGSTAMKLCF
jgi:GNAT superfamily N-acetyltransferase